jgi:hypothetical protein
VPIDHDQRFKEMLREFLAELVALFLPWLAQRWDQTTVDWQPQEVFSNPPSGQVWRLDLLALLHRPLGEGKRWEQLVHLEVESAASLTEVRKKLGARYYPAIRNQHPLPLTCLGVYLHVGLQGQGWDEYAEHDPEAGEQAEPVYRVRWRYVGLPALPAEQYVASGNWLAVALSALMKIDPGRKGWLKAEILRRLATECQENDYRKLLLLDCAETYLPLEGEQELAYQRLVKEDPRYREANTMILTTYDRGVAEGEAKGRREALLEVIIQLASPRCGTPDESVQTRLRQIEDLARLQTLVSAATTAPSWQHLLADN